MGKRAPLFIKREKLEGGPGLLQGADEATRPGGKTPTTSFTSKA